MIGLVTIIPLFSLVNRRDQHYGVCDRYYYEFCLLSLVSLPQESRSPMKIFNYTSERFADSVLLAEA